jgi:hypothetical protein
MYPRQVFSTGTVSRLYTRIRASEFHNGNFQSQAGAFRRLSVAGRLRSPQLSVRYQFDGKLDQIKAAVMWVNSADDAVNPPDLGTAEDRIKKVKHGRFVLLPISAQLRPCRRNRSAGSIPRCFIFMAGTCYQGIMQSCYLKRFVG